MFVPIPLDRQTNPFKRYFWAPIRQVMEECLGGELWDVVKTVGCPVPTARHYLAQVWLLSHGRVLVDCLCLAGMGDNQDNVPAFRLNQALETMVGNVLISIFPTPLHPDPWPKQSDHQNSFTHPAQPCQ